MHHNINKLPTDGYLVLPLSMSRLQTGQSPDICYEILQYFEQKVESYGVDVVFLYTNGLYFNVNDNALDVRRQTNKLMGDHKNRLQNLILKNCKFMPQAFHYLPWDYVLLNGLNFNDQLLKLRKAYETDELMQQAVSLDVAGRGSGDDANVQFVLEEVVATHIVRQKMIELPKTLVKKDTFRLIVYPGPYILTDAYQYEHKILDVNPSLGHEAYPFACAHYDYDARTLYDFRNFMKESGASNVVELLRANPQQKKGKPGK